MTKANEIKVESIQMDRIYADYAWNSRSRHDVLSSQSDGVMNLAEGIREGDGFTGLCISIAANGQDSPVTVCKIKDKRSLAGNTVDFEYELVCGFRRFTAIAYHHEKKNKIPRLESMHIWAIVRDLMPIEARLMNLRENTDRSSLSPADLTWGILQLKARGLTGIMISEQLNISAGYVAKLWKIASLPLPVLEHWRGGKNVKLPGIPLAANGEAIPTRVLSSVQLYKIADTVTDANEKTQMYVDLALGRKPKDSTSMMIDLAEERVKDAARFAAELVASGVLRAGDLQWSKVIGPRQYGFLISTGNLSRDPGPRLQKLWQLAQETYENTLVMMTKKLEK